MLSSHNELNKMEQKSNKSSKFSVKNTSKRCKENKMAAISRKDKAAFPKSDSLRSSLNAGVFLFQETSNIRNNYLTMMINSELAKSNIKFREDFLRSHQISAEVRARMVLLLG